MTKAARWIALAILIGVGALFFSACVEASTAVPAQSDTGKFFEEKYQLLPDGRTVLCLYKERFTGYGGGNTMSCDWENIEPR